MIDLFKEASVILYTCRQQYGLILWNSLLSVSLVALNQIVKYYLPVCLPLISSGARCQTSNVNES
jgi:hypothetical protein